MNRLSGLPIEPQTGDPPSIEEGEALDAGTAKEELEKLWTVPSFFPTKSAFAERLYDLRGLLERLDRDRDLLAELAELFLREAPTLLETVRAAVKRGDAREVERAAHKLTRSVGNFGASGAHEAALVLERMGRAGNLDGASAALERLERALGGFCRLLDKVRREMAA